jgi:two-component system nitrogen regulation response regulator GlnG
MLSEVVVLSSEQDDTALIKNTLKSQGCDVRAAQGISSALRAMKGNELVVLNLNGENESALKEIMSYHPDAVILVADSQELQGKVLKDGAYDFLPRPLDTVKLGAAARNAFNLISYREEINRLKSTDAPHLVTPKNRTMLRVHQQVDRASAKKVPVLLLGEKGTGKDVAAKTIHYNSSRAAGPLVTVEDPSAEGDAGLFGRATTKGVSHGKIMSAAGGTIHIKNVDSLDTEISRKLALFIKEKRFTPEGSDDAIRADVRVICSAPSLDARSSLFKNFRTKITIPPLRERPEDIVPLAEHFLKNDCVALKTGAKRFSRGARDYLSEGEWPGNAGELKNAVKKACLLANEPVVERRHLASGDGAAYCSVMEFLDDKLKGYLKGMAKVGNSSLYDTVTSEVEKSLIELALRETGGNQLKASKLLGLNRNTLRARIKLYKIKNGRKP